MDFEDLLKWIQKGNSISPSEVLPHLSQEKCEERCRVNFKLAEVYSMRGDFQQAKIFISRSWMLSKFSSEVLPLYIKIHSALDDIGPIREAYKRLGMIESVKGNITEALRYFNLWQYAFADHQKLDKYDYDFDILERIEQMAKPWRFRDYDPANVSNSRKIRVAYLVFGMSHLNSVLIKINLMFAKYHDKDRFVITIFVPEICKSQEAIERIEMFKSYHCDVIVAPGPKNDLENLLAVGNQIHNYKPDILVISALLAEFEHYFIRCLRPAPVVVGLLQGPPAQFIAPCLDWSISWSRHPLIDSPCDCSLVHIGLDLPDVDSVKPYAKKELNIPENGQILLSAGRHVKFQNIDFWKSIFDILSSFPNLYYVAVGVSPEQISFLDDLSTPELAERIRLLGWRYDALNIFCLADVVIDTFPSGGGHVLIEAMALGIPFVSFENDYMKRFDPSDWSVADEFVSIPELIINRGDFGQFKCVVSNLISDEVYRSKMGKVCKEQIQLSMGSPERGVRKYESILVDIIERKLNHKREYFYGINIKKYLNKLLNKCKE